MEHLARLVRKLAKTPADAQQLSPDSTESPQAVFIEMLRSQLSANADAHFQAGADKDDIIVSQYDTMTHLSARSALPAAAILFACA